MYHACVTAPKFWLLFSHQKPVTGACMQDLSLTHLPSLDCADSDAQHCLHNISSTCVTAMSVLSKVEPDGLMKNVEQQARQHACMCVCTCVCTWYTSADTMCTLLPEHLSTWANQRSSVQNSMLKSRQTDRPTDTPQTGRNGIRLSVQAHLQRLPTQIGLQSVQTSSKGFRPRMIPCLNSGSTLVGISRMILRIITCTAHRKNPGQFRIQHRPDSSCCIVW